MAKRSRRVERYIYDRRRTAGCMTDCVAYWFNVHPENVPAFVYPQMGWKRRLFAYFRRRGYVVWFEACTKAPRRGTHIMIGDSLAFAHRTHFVVYRNGRLVFDPTHPSLWRECRITHRLVVRRIDG